MEYCRRHYDIKLDNSDEKDKFLERHSLPKLTQEETDHLNSPLSIKEIDLVVKNLPMKKAEGSDDFISESYQMFKDEIIPILQYKLSQKIEREWIYLNPF